MRTWRSEGLEAEKGLAAGVRKGPAPLLRQMGRLVFWLRQMRVRPTYFFIAVFCTFLAVYCDLLGLRFFIPLLQGFISGGDFAAVGDKLGVIRALGRYFPALVATPVGAFSTLFAIVMGAFLAKSALNYSSSLLLHRQIREADSAILETTIARFLGFGKAMFDVTNIGAVGYKIISIPPQVSRQIAALHAMLSEVMTLTGYMAIMLWISWQLALATLVIFPLHYVLTHRLIKKIREISKAQETSRISLAEKLFNVFSCIALVKAYAAEPLESKRLGRECEREIGIAHEMEKTQLLIKPVRELSLLLSLVLMALVMAFVIPARGASQLSAYLVFLFIARKAIPHFGAFATFRQSLASAGGAFERLESIFLDESKSDVPSGTEEFTGLRGSIEFRDLTFAYRKKLPALRGLSLRIEKGRMTAVVGRSGSGKSTLAQLLMRFYDCPSGTILLDGKDIRSFKTASLMRHLAYVSQDTLLFNDTLRANLVYGLEPEPNGARLAEALRLAELDQMVQALPQRLETLIGDRGVKLSGGEKQRVAIARAFLKGSEILVLDEATSALDTETERKVQAAMEGLMRDRTAIVIAHRLSTIMKADKVAVIEEGRVVEEGMLAALIEKKGAFHRYWKAQENRLAPEAPLETMV